MNNNSDNKEKKIEILAPCGSYEILTAAIHAGADACYIGGNSFGARAYAENFDADTIKKAVYYAHLHGVKVYLTVNTLCKQDELPMLYESIRPFYESGGDALIIQDFGVFSYVKKQFPDIAIHCSTQMNVTSCYGAALMKKQGASRVVTAREMSLDEIRTIKEQVDIEVETFVHGAMCYSYSGQCLMSSLAGGRSGNRGRCAQPCRKCYDESYLLSMKDLCSLTDIPKLIEAGIDSLKIEGRMKNAYYVASAVHAYRTIADDYIHGCFDEKKAEALRFELANIYNRGGFTDGYFFRHNGTEMLSKDRPNNQGVCIGNLEGVGNGAIRLRLSKPLYRQDVLEVTTYNKEPLEITSAKDGVPGELVTLNCPKTKSLLKKQPVYRTKCPTIIEHVEADYIQNYKKLPVSMQVTAKIGTPITVSAQLYCKETKHCATVMGDIVEKSNGQNLIEDTVKKPFAQLGNTEYILHAFQLDADTDAFLPAGLLKKLRRAAIEKLEQAVCLAYTRTCPAQLSVESFTTDVTSIRKIREKNNPEQRIFFGIETITQLEILLGEAAAAKIPIYGITVPFHLYEACRKIVGESLRLYVALPHVISTKNGNAFTSFLTDLQNKHGDYLQDSSFSGIYIRNIDSLALASSLNLAKDCELLCDASLYCYNYMAFSYLQSFVQQPLTCMLPRELSVKELNDISDMPICLTLYEYQPVMITANCIQKTKYGCTHENAVCTITDEKKNRFFVKCVCNDCYNVIYNKLPFSILDTYKEPAFHYLHKMGYMIHFTIEREEMIKQVIQTLSNLSDRPIEKTSGHLYRGVL